MFLIVTDEDILKKVTVDNNFTYLYTKTDIFPRQYVFVINNDSVHNFNDKSIFEFGFKDNPKYKITNNLVF